jgi:hypothetical protein
MFPPTHSLRRSTLIALAATILTVPGALAQDGATVDTTQMLQQLKQLREQAATKTKADKQRTIQEISAAAASADGAYNAWEKAIMATKFDGLTKEATQFKNWRETEGEAYKEPEVKNAMRLYFQWLNLTLQRSSGAKVKDMLPALVNYVKDLSADGIMIDNHTEEVRHEREKEARRGGGGPGGGNGPGGGGRDNVRRIHDDILGKPLSGSMVVDWLKLGEWVKVGKDWVDTPGDFDGIFETIILPELRAQKDQRALEYWDIRIKREGDRAAQSKLDFEREKFTTVKMPSLMWKKATEMSNVGMRNRAATEMMNLIKTYPNHPESGSWMSQLEVMLNPAAATPVTTGTAPATTAPATTSTPPAPAALAPAASNVPAPR